MDRRKATVGVAAIGVVVGVVAVGIIAAPAGAGQAPTLPATTPDALVASVVTSSVPAMAGTVQIVNNLGLPALPGMGLPSQLTAGTSDDIRVWTDGTDKARISIPAPNSEETVVDTGSMIYEWNSADRSVTEHSLKPASDHRAPSAPQAMPKEAIDPMTAAKALISEIRKTSNVSVEGTDMVANRPAYDLVLSPKSNERTLLREVRIAIDAQTHIPLQLTVLADNTDTPALQIGFSSLNLGPQDPSLFTFTVPAGATVDKGNKLGQKSMEAASSVDPKVVGAGWDTVIVAQLPTDQGNGRSGLPLGLIQELGKPVSGTWGSGTLISTNVATALITSDGRVAAGFVPEQVLAQALESGK